MDLPSPQVDNRRGRVDWSLDRFRSFITQKGVDLLWEQAADCPCTRLSTHAGLDLRNVDIDVSVAHGRHPNCPTCKGTGVIHHSGQTIRAIVTGAKDQSFVRDFGQLRPGEVSVSALPEHLPGVGDRYTLKHSVMVRKETIISGESSLKYPIVSRTLSLLNGDTVVNVLYAHKAEGTGEALVNGVLDSADYSIVEGVISFPGVANGTRVSVTYYAAPVYVVVDLPHCVRDSVTIRNLPSEQAISLISKVACRLEYQNA